MTDFGENDELSGMVLSASRIATAIIDASGCLAYSNAAFDRLLGYPPQRISGVGLAHLTAAAADIGALAYQPTGPGYTGLNCQFVREDGGTIWVEAVASAFSHEGSEAIVLQLIDIEPHRQREMALELKESRLSFALEAASQGVWDHDIRTDTMFYSSGWRRMRGMPADEVVDGSMEAWIERLHPDDRAYIRSVAKRQDAGDRNFRILEYRELHRNGHYIWVQSRGRPVAWDEYGNATRTIGTDTDITEHKEAEEAFQRLSQRFELALQVSKIGVWEQDLRSGETVWDKRTFEIYGRTPSDDPLRNADWVEAIHPHDLAAAQDDVDKALKLEGQYSSQFRIVLPTGQVRHIRSRAQIFETTSTSKLIGAEWDVTDEVLRSEELHRAMALAESRYIDLLNAQADVQHAALHDYLTDLPNRRFLDQALNERRTQSQSREDKLAALHIDLDRFKQINDTMGHAAGDAMLRHVANVLRLNIREGDFIARIGGDEFVILCWFRGDADDLGKMAERIIESLRNEVPYGGKFMNVGASIGIAFDTELNENAARLLQAADAAAYRAKDAGRNRYEFADWS